MIHDIKFKDINNLPLNYDKDKYPYLIVREVFNNTTQKLEYWYYAGLFNLYNASKILHQLDNAIILDTKKL